MIIDYTVAVECENPEVYYTCRQCGKCGRKFENGFMIDDGGTTIDEEEQRQVSRIDRKEAAERIQEVMTIIRTQHMCKDMDGECTTEDRETYIQRFEALRMAIEALQEQERKKEQEG